MSIIDKINLKQIKYYGKNDLSTNLLINEFQKNQDLIIQSIINYQDYDSLLTSDFILGFYILNLLFLNEDITNNFFPRLDLQIKHDYNNEILKIMSNLKLQNIKHAIKIFKGWILNNVNIVISKNFNKSLNKFLISYNSILDIFVNNLFFDNEEQVKRIILLIEKTPLYYCKFLSFKYKNIIGVALKTFISNLMKNKVNLIQYLELVDSYIILIKKDKILQEEVTCYCKNQINQINNIMHKISTAELFINLINKHGLKFKCTKDLSLWYENLKVELFNSDQINWTEFSFNPFKNQKEFDDKMNKVKSSIKNKNYKNLFYDSKNKSSFFYEKKNKNHFLDLFDNSTGTYNQNFIQTAEMSQGIKLQFFWSLSFDEKVFKIYIDNFADSLECIFYNLGIIEEERIFFVERYYEIVKQINHERKEIQNQEPFSYMKKITLVLTAIEDFIKIFIRKNENGNFTIVNNNINNSPFSSYLVNKNNIEFEKGIIFSPSNYILDFLSDNAKLILNYYLYASTLNGGLEIRNLTIHGSYLSKKFFNQYWFFKISLLFFQLIEELTMNYIKSEVNKLNLNDFFKNINQFDYEGEKLKISDFINTYENYLKQEFQKFIKKNKLTVSDYAINFKINYCEMNNNIELEVEIFKTFIQKFKGNINFY